MPEPLVVGLDAGGTATRAVVVSPAGGRVGEGRAGGGNPTSHGAPAAARQIRAALEAALSGLDPGLVRAGCLGLAGAGRLRGDPRARAAFDRAWRDAGLRCAYTVVSDALVAYAAGSCAPAGTVLVAGTGAIAAEVRDLALHRFADGHGWLLGDAGSGYWLGREAVRATLARLDRGRSPDRLGREVLTALLGAEHPGTPDRETVDDLVQAVTRRPPVELAGLAPLVVRAAADGDPAASGTVATAARHLTDSVGRIRAPGATTPVVLGGGLLAGGTPVTDAVRAELARRWPQAALLTAGDGAAGAAWLAARPLPGVGDPARLHRRLLGPPSG
jgi:N-acetylglucosamine kinase-like BadF-type ATPase